MLASLIFWGRVVSLPCVPVWPDSLALKKLVPVVIMAILSGCGANEPAPIDSIVVEVTGEDFNWHFHYPGADGEFGTEDDRYSEHDLYLPASANVTLRLHSKDFIYTLSIPEIDRQEIAVPDLDFDMRFRTGAQNTWALRGDQFCGFSHESLLGNIYVRDQRGEGFYNW